MAPRSSLETLKLAFNVSSDEQSSHPDDLSVSVGDNVSYQAMVTRQSLGLTTLNAFSDDKEITWMT